MALQPKQRHVAVRGPWAGTLAAGCTSDSSASCPYLAPCRPPSSSHCVLAPPSLQVPQTTAPFPPAPTEMPSLTLLQPCGGKTQPPEKGRVESLEDTGKASSSRCEFGASLSELLSIMKKINFSSN